MNPYIKILSIGAALLVANAASGQTNVKKSFDKLVNNSSAVVTEKHSLERDARTQKMISQYDIYRFAIPASKSGLVKDIEKAFRQDADKAYSIASGVRGVYDRPVVMAIGEGDDTGVVMAERVGANYIYGCYLDPDDKHGNHRYAYAMDWINVGDSISGTLAVTYSTTLKYRQQQSARQYSVQPGSDNGSPYDDAWAFTGIGGQQRDRSQQWLSTFLTYATGMSSDDTLTCRAIAAKLYELTSSLDSYPDIKAADRTTAADVLKSIISENRDSVVETLLKGSLNNLK